MVNALIVPADKMESSRCVKLEDVTSLLRILGYRHTQSDNTERCAFFFFASENPSLEINQNILSLRGIRVRGECIVLRETCERTEQKDKLVDCNELPRRKHTTPFERSLNNTPVSEDLQQWPRQ